MAAVNLVFSMSVLDDKGSRATIPIYGQMDDATTLAQINTFAATFVEYFDSVTEAQIVSISLALLLTNPVTLKAAPVANSDVEEGALFSFPLEGLPSKSYGVEIPAFNQSMFIDNEVDLSDLAVQDLITNLTNPSLINPKNNVWSHSLASPPRKAYKTFRKRAR